MTDSITATATELFYTPEVQPNLALQLGRLITRWGWPEAIAEDIIAGLLSTHTSLLYPITADIAIGTRLKHLRMIAKLRLGDPSEFRKLVRVITRMEKLCQWRNQIIHGLWYKGDIEGDTALVMETRPTKDAEIRPIGQYFNELWILYLVNETARCTSALWRFGKTYNLILPPLESSP